MTDDTTTTTTVSFLYNHTEVPPLGLRDRDVVVGACSVTVVGVVVGACSVTVVSVGGALLGLGA